MFKESMKTYKFIKNFKSYKNAEDDFARERAALYLKEMMGEDGGLLTKLMQYMGTSDSAADEIQSISHRVLHGLNLDDILPIIKSHIGDKVHDFSNLSDFAMAASVGQVHRASHISGVDVAIKIQYPNIKKTFEKQFQLLNLIPKVEDFVPTAKWGISFSKYQEALQQLIDQECNYLYEVDELNKWKKYLKPIQNVDVPSVLPGYSKEEFYVQEFIDGDSLEDVLKYWNEEEKKQLAKLLMSSFFYLFFAHGVIQGDTNHGNFIFQKNDTDIKVNYIDLGQTVRFGPEFISGFWHLISSGLKGEAVDSLGIMTMLGFDVKKLKPIHAQLPLLLDVLREPFISDFAMKFVDWKYTENIDTLLGENKWWFRSAGGVDFFLFMKGFLGLKNLIQKLDVTIFYKPIFEDVLNKRNETIPIPIPKILIEKEYFLQVRSNSIKISVSEGGKDKVKVTLPFHSLFDLENILDDGIKRFIEENSIDFKKIIRDSLSDGGNPKVFFSEIIEGKKIILEMI